MNSDPVESVARSGVFRCLQRRPEDAGHFSCHCSKLGQCCASWRTGPIVAFSAQAVALVGTGLMTVALALLAFELAGPAAGAVLGTALAVLGVLAGLGAAVAVSQWPRSDPEVIQHRHPELAADHPHLVGSAGAHAHPYVIDGLHVRWPLPDR